MFREGRTCFDVRRSRPALNIPSCQVTLVREQTDMLTHWLDASNVYGSSQEELDSVRQGDSYRLREGFKNSSSTD